MPNSLGRPAFALDRLYRADLAAHFRGDKKRLAWNSRAQGLMLEPHGSSSRTRRHRGVYTSPPVRAEFPFHEIVPSWNIRINENTQGYRIYIRVGTDESKWSPWFYFGSAGTYLLSPPTRKTVFTRSWGTVNIDYLSLVKPATRFQYQVELETRGPLSSSWQNRVALQRFFVSYSNTGENAQLHKVHAARVKPVIYSGEVATRVPYRSQLAVPVKKLRGQICCPTCVAMVLEKHGIDKATLQVAEEAYDPEHKIYGTWPRASQAAANNGLEAWIQRFRTHGDVKKVLAKGQPLMASIRVSRGELPRSSYRKSNGHLILICGFRASGSYIVNDPYCCGPGGAEIDYSAEEIEKVWLDKGGVGIIIRQPSSKKG